MEKTQGASVKIHPNRAIIEDIIMVADQLLTGVKSAEALLGAGGRGKVFPIVDKVGIYMIVLTDLQELSRLIKLHESSALPLL